MKYVVAAGCVLISLMILPGVSSATCLGFGGDDDDDDAADPGQEIEPDDDSDDDSDDDPNDDANDDLDDDADDDADDDLDDDVNDDLNDDANDDLDDDADDDDLSPVYIRRVDGGAPGEDGVAAALIDEGDFLIIATVGNRLAAYRYLDGEIQAEENVCDNGSYPSLFVDGQGNAHVSFYDTVENGISYATDESGAWRQELVEEHPNIQHESSITLDSSGSVHISYNFNLRLKYATNASGNWTNQFVDNSFQVDLRSSIAVDPQGYVHIAYWNYSSMELLHARNTFGYWSLEAVDCPTYPGASRFILIDDDGAIHISYLKSTQTLIHAYGSAGSWTKEAVEGGGWGDESIMAAGADGAINILYGYWSVLRDSHLAVQTDSGWNTGTLTGINSPGDHQIGFDVDDAGHAYIGYRELTDENLQYATNLSGSWQRGVIAEGVRVEWGTAIAAQPDGAVHIAYIIEEPRNLKYATNAGGNWATETLDDCENVRTEAKILLDAGLAPHVIYGRIPEPSGLYHLYRQGGEWIGERINENVNTGDYLDATFGADGTLYVGHYNYATDNIEFTSNATGDWVTEVVDGGDDWDPVIGIAVDGSGAAHMSYYKSNHLWYATNAGGAWQSAQIDDAPGSGMGSSIAASPDGNVYISYYGSFGGLKIASNEGDGWSFETVDWAGSVAFWSDSKLVMDADEKLHVVYYSEVDKDLYYATNQSGSWVAAVIASDGEAGFNPSLSLDDMGDAHASFMSGNALWYARFPKNYQGVLK